MTLQLEKGRFKIEYEAHDSIITLMRRRPIAGDYLPYGTFHYIFDFEDNLSWNFLTDEDGQFCMDVDELGDILHLLSQLKAPTY